MDSRRHSMEYNNVLPECKDVVASHVASAISCAIDPAPPEVPQKFNQQLRNTQGHASNRTSWSICCRNPTWVATNFTANAMSLTRTFITHIQRILLLVQQLLLAGITMITRLAHSNGL